MKKLLRIGVSWLLLTSAWIWVPLIHSENEKPVPPSFPDNYWLELKNRIDFQIRHFPGLAGIYIKDMKRGWVIEYNADELFPSASLVKLPVMASLYEAEAMGRLSLDEYLPLQRRLKAAGSGSLKHVRQGVRLSIRQLVYRMITESDNTATNILTDYLGLPYFNASFERLGLRHTNISRMIMDLKERQKGVENYTTPRDMAKVLELIYSKKLTGSPEMMAILKDQKVRDRLAQGIPSDWPLGHKTGLMNNGCHDVGIVFSPTGDYIVCVLTSKMLSTRRSKNFISEIAHLTTLYYGDPTLQREARNNRRWKSSEPL